MDCNHVQVRVLLDFITQPGRAKNLMYIILPHPARNRKKFFDCYPDLRLPIYNESSLNIFGELNPPPLSEVLFLSGGVRQFNWGTERLDMKVINYNDGVTWTPNLIFCSFCSVLTWGRIYCSTTRVELGNVQYASEYHILYICLRLYFPWKSSAYEL